MRTTRPTQTREHVLLVGLGLKRPSRIPGQQAIGGARESLNELAALAHSANATVVGSILQMRDAVDPATVVGRGKLEEIAAEATSLDASLIIFDGNLTPVQQRNLER